VFDAAVGYWVDPCSDWMSYSWEDDAENAPWAIDFCTYAGGRTVHATVIINSLQLDNGSFDFVCGVSAKRGQTLKFFYGRGTPSAVVDTGIVTENLVPGPTDTKGFFDIGVAETISSFDVSSRFGWGLFDEAFMFDKAYTPAQLAQQLYNLRAPTPGFGVEAPPPVRTTSPGPNSGAAGTPPPGGANGEVEVPSYLPAGEWARVPLTQTKYSNGVTFDAGTDEAHVSRRGIYNVIVNPGWNYNLGPGEVYYQLVRLVVRHADGSTDVLGTIDSRYDAPSLDMNFAFESTDHFYAEAWHNSPYTLTLYPTTVDATGPYMLVRFVRELVAS
jgi:hypothetical protein